MSFSINAAGNFSDFLAGAVAGGAVGAAILALGALLILIGLAVYAYFAFAWMTIGKKMKYKKSWLAWIPFANISMILQMGGFHWAWVFLALIPVVGWIALYALVTIATWRIFEKLRYAGWLSLAPLINFIPGFGMVGTIAYLIIIGIVAWKK